MLTQPNIHGHEVLHLVHTASPAFTRPSLEAEAARRWGPEARFYTCSRQGMTFGELMEFLVGHAKVVETGGVLAVNLGNMCSHGEDHDDDGY